MKYRKLDQNKDYVFGENTQNFVTDLEAVKQAIYSRLKLLLGEWWEDIEDGLPFFEQIAGKTGSQSNLNAADLVIRDRIINTENVLDLLDYNGVLDHTTRQYSVTAKVNTTFGVFELEVTF